MIVKLLTEHHLEFLSLNGGCICSSESTHVKYHIVGNLMHWLISVTIDTSNIVPAVSDDSDTPVINCIGKTSRVCYFFP